MPQAGVRPARAAVPAWSAAGCFSASAAQIARARQFLAELIDECAGHQFARREDAVLCLSEVATNAVRHSRSRRPGGKFTVRVAVAAAGVRVEVTDEGGPWCGQPGPDCEPGLGLVILAALASRWGVAGDESGRTVWFEIASPAA